MKEFPDNLKAYKRLPNYTQNTIPPGLLKAHSTKPGTWAKINIISGSLVYTILEPEKEKTVLRAGDFGVVEPTIKHEVKALGSVEFYVELYKK